MIRPSLLALPVLAALLPGCQQTQRPRASPAVATACRAEVDRVYAAQNRIDLSTRDQRDTPFAANFQPGNTTRGLGAAYGRDNQYAACVNNNAPTTPGTPPGATPAGATPVATPSPAPGSTFSPSRGPALN